MAYGLIQGLHDLHCKVVWIHPCENRPVNEWLRSLGQVGVSDETCGWNWSAWDSMGAFWVFSFLNFWCVCVFVRVFCWCLRTSVRCTYVLAMHRSAVAVLNAFRSELLAQQAARGTTNLPNGV